MAAPEIPSTILIACELRQRAFYGMIGVINRERMCAKRVLSNPLFIACHLVTPAYISYWSALHFYGLTEQVPLTTFVATTKKKRPVTFQGLRFRFVTVKAHKFFGYRRERIGDLPVLIADEAKAIVDSLDQHLSYQRRSNGCTPKAGSGTQRRCVSTRPRSRTGASWTDLLEMQTEKVPQ